MDKSELKGKLAYVSSQLEVVMNQLQSLSDRMDRLEQQQQQTLSLHSDLSVIRGQIHALAKQTIDMSTNSPALEVHVSLPDLLEYAQSKKSKKNTLCTLINTCCQTIPELHSYRIVNDLSFHCAATNVPPRIMEPYNAAWRQFLEKVILKEDFLPGAQSTQNEANITTITEESFNYVLNYLCSIGVPLYNPTNPHDVLFAPLIPRVQSTIGLSPIYCFNSITRSLPPAQMSIITDEEFAGLLYALQLFNKIQTHFLNSLEDFQKIDEDNGILPQQPRSLTTTLQRIYTIFSFFLPQRAKVWNATANDSEALLSAVDDPKISFLEFYYIIAFFLHIATAGATLDEFKFRHPIVNHLLADDELPTLAPHLGAFLTTKMALTITNNGVEYKLFCDLFKAKLNRLDFFQPPQINNPNEYLRLATNGEALLETKYPQLVKDMVSREIML